MISKTSRMNDDPVVYDRPRSETDPDRALACLAVEGPASTAAPTSVFQRIEADRARFVVDERLKDLVRPDQKGWRRGMHEIAAGGLQGRRRPVQAEAVCGRWRIPVERGV